MEKYYRLSGKVNAIYFVYLLLGAFVVAGLTLFNGLLLSGNVYFTIYSLYLMCFPWLMGHLLGTLIKIGKMRNKLLYGLSISFFFLLFVHCRISMHVTELYRSVVPLSYDTELYRSVVPPSYGTGDEMPDSHALLMAQMQGIRQGNNPELAKLKRRVGVSVEIQNMSIESNMLRHMLLNPLDCLYITTKYGIYDGMHIKWGRNHYNMTHIRGAGLISLWFFEFMIILASMIMISYRKYLSKPFFEETNSWGVKKDCCFIMFQYQPRQLFDLIKHALEAEYAPYFESLPLAMDYSGYCMASYYEDPVVKQPYVYLSMYNRISGIDNRRNYYIVKHLKVSVAFVYELEEMIKLRQLRW